MSTIPRSATDGKTPFGHAVRNSTIAWGPDPDGAGLPSLIVTSIRAARRGFRRDDPQEGRSVRDVLLALIGPACSGDDVTRAEVGASLSAHDHDFVRIEILTALERGHLRHPGAASGRQKMPGRRLPAALSKLSHRNAIEIRAHALRSGRVAAMSPIVAALVPCTLGPAAIGIGDLPCSWPEALGSSIFSRLALTPEKARAQLKSSMDIWYTADAFVSTPGAAKDAMALALWSSRRGWDAEPRRAAGVRSEQRCSSR